MGKQYKPSDFAAIGNPSCSVWGKSELEWIALAYVRALANLGDRWQSLTRAQAYEALTDQEKQEVHGMLTADFEPYQHWFDRVAERINSSDGALSVRGFWHEHALQANQAEPVSAPAAGGES